MEVGQVLKSPGLIVILLLAVFNAAADLWTGRIMYGTPTHSLTANVIDTLRQGFPLFLLMISIFYGGELVWRERDRKLHEILDATPTADWVIVVPKVAAIALVLMLVNLAGVLTAPARRGFVQGNFDPALLHLTGAALTRAIDEFLAPMAALTPEARRGWICGLGHGVLPGTPETSMRTFVRTVRRRLG